MKRIIKPGKIEDTTRRFKCPYCGCVFDADEDDYILSQDTHNDFTLESECPTCNATVVIEEE
jgi:endogenous inhibitor of DNA gyrase (YacG/DUF329 family)